MQTWVTAARPHPAGAALPPGVWRISVDIVVPVLDEATTLERSVRQLRQQLDMLAGFTARIVIVDNGSSDATLALALHLAEILHGIDVIHLEQRGRGRALRAAWQRSTADVVAYMDVDLSTDLGALAGLLALVTDGGAAIAIGSRLLPGAHVIDRGAGREVISRAYNRLLRSALGVGFHDAQCGFKAMRREVATRLLPEVADEGWFFDTELLVRAERAGLRIVELPVRWTDDPDSRVAILRTAWQDLQGIRRLRGDCARAMAPPLRGPGGERQAG